VKFSVILLSLFKDPNEWKEHFSSCGGEHQSPINLDLSKAMAVDYPKFSFNNYDQVFPEMVTNNGHTGKSNAF
jgi:carbonic anhydrase